MLSVMRSASTTVDCVTPSEYSIDALLRAVEALRLVSSGDGQALLRPRSWHRESCCGAPEFLTAGNSDLLATQQAVLESLVLAMLGSTGRGRPSSRGGGATPAGSSGVQWVQKCFYTMRIAYTSKLSSSSMDRGPVWYSWCGMQRA